MQAKTSSFVAFLVAIGGLGLILLAVQFGVFRPSASSSAQRLPSDLCATVRSTSQSLESEGKVRFDGGGRVSIMPVAWQTLPRSAQDGLIKTAAMRVACVQQTDPRDVVVTVTDMQSGAVLFEGTPPA